MKKTLFLLLIAATLFILFLGSAEAITFKMHNSGEVKKIASGNALTYYLHLAYYDDKIAQFYISTSAREKKGKPTTLFNVKKHGSITFPDTGYFGTIFEKTASSAIKFDLGGQSLKIKVTNLETPTFGRNWAYFEVTSAGGTTSPASPTFPNSGAVSGSPSLCKRNINDYVQQISSEYKGKSIIFSPFSYPNILYNFSLESAGDGFAVIRVKRSVFDDRQWKELNGVGKGKFRMSFGEAKEVNTNTYSVTTNYGELNDVLVDTVSIRNAKFETHLSLKVSGYKTSPVKSWGSGLPIIGPVSDWIRSKIKPAFSDVLVNGKIELQGDPAIKCSVSENAEKNAPSPKTLPPPPVFPNEKQSPNNAASQGFEIVPVKFTEISSILSGNDGVKVEIYNPGKEKFYDYPARVDLADNGISRIVYLETRNGIEERTPPAQKVVDFLAGLFKTPITGSVKYRVAFFSNGFKNSFEFYLNNNSTISNQTTTNWVKK